MKIYAINGGPRKTWNTATMLQSFLDGAKSAEANIETEMIHLFDLDFKGCRSCYGCKRIGGTYGKCSIKDDLLAILPKISLADGLVLGCPIYYYNMTGELRSFLERLLFPYDSFEKGEATIAPRSLETAIIYTMNVTESRMRQAGYDRNLVEIERTIGNIFSSDPQILYAFNTYEFDDYSKYRASYWNEPDKAVWKKTQFPIDCRNAYNAGKHMAGKIQAEKTAVFES